MNFAGREEVLDLEVGQIDWFLERLQAERERESKAMNRASKTTTTSSDDD